MSLVNLLDAKAHLNIPATVTTYDTQLQAFVDALQVPVEDIAGPILPRPVVGEVHVGGQLSVATLLAPVLSIQSVVEYVGGTSNTLTSQPLGSGVDDFGYELLSPAGTILRRAASGINIRFASSPFGGPGTLPYRGGLGRGEVTISYTAGYATVPPAVRLGALELVRHWWQHTQQGGRPGFNSAAGDDGYQSAGNYLIPYFVAELLRSTPYNSQQIPGIA